VIEPLRPARGGFLRPFSTAWFIQEFLLGNGPQGSPKIDPDVGAPMVDIHRAYKEALHRVWAEDMVARDEEGRLRRGLPPFSIEEAEERTQYYLERIPYKLTKMRYASFTTYFAHLKRLGYVEETGKEEASLIQKSYPPAPPRRYYRLTEAGKRATMAELSDPITTLYHYPREKRSAKRRYYSRGKRR
jgi:DNA-binding PadR family transcriptional regulator